MHGYLSRFAKLKYPDSKQVAFGDIKDQVEEILRFEGDQERRVKQWCEAISKGVFQAEESNKLIPYDHNEWESEKEKFSSRDSSSECLNTHVYRFHQGAALHRYYVLKDLLPKHGVAVY